MQIAIVIVTASSYAIISFDEEFFSIFTVDISSYLCV